MYSKTATVLARTARDKQPQCTNDNIARFTQNLLDTYTRLIRATFRKQNAQVTPHDHE